MAKKATKQLNTFKRLDDDRILLEGIVYHRAFSKMIEVINEDKSKIHSIKVDGIYYYPSKIDQPKTI